MKQRIIGKVIIFFSIFIYLCLSLAAQQREQAGIQLAILLDTSNSMDGLINQAKSQLWKIVNELSLAKRNGRTPSLEVALYEYGNDGLSARTGHIRQVVELTTDLDRISEQLFALSTNGGHEYCGQVIHTAINKLDWSVENDHLKIIYIAGNEPFTQGTIDFQKACRYSIRNGIIVNTIFCGDYQEGIRTFWKKGADLADGTYININQNQIVREIPTPYDDEILQLNDELNTTYVAYGVGGAEKKQRQIKQDKNAKKMSKSVMVQRSAAKASSHYANESWDLADAYERDEEALERVPPNQLPEEMQNMNSKEKEKYVKNLITKRETLQKKIKELNTKRNNFIQKQMKKQNSENTLDSAIISTLHQQAKNRNFTFEK